MAIRPLAIRNAEAEQRLIAMLDRATEVFHTLGNEPILVAECPNRFNDAFWDDRWFAAQVGAACWEQAEYLEGRTEPLVQEKGRDQSSRGIRAARRVLRDLAAADWRAELHRCLGREFVNDGDVVCLALQYGQPWICSADSNGATGIACTWAPSWGLIHVATCDRIDHNIGDSYPVRLAELRSDIWAYLTPRTRAYFRPEIRDGAAANRLCDILSKATGKIRGITSTASEPVIMKASKSSMFDGQPKLRWASEYGPSTDTPMRWPKTVTRTFDRLSEVLDALEEACWRELFAKSIGLLKDGDLLGLVVHDSRPMLVWELTAFDFVTGELQVIGLCNRLDVVSKNWKLEIHPAE